MRVIIARNAHQALTESCYQLEHFGQADDNGGKVLPIPTTSTILNPQERVALYEGLDPFDALLGGAQDMAEHRLRHVSHCAAALKRDPATQVTLRGGDCESLGAVYVQVDMDGKVMLMATRHSSEVTLDPRDMVYLSFVMEYIAITTKRPVGALWITTMRPTCWVDRLPIVQAIAKHAPEPPAQFDDPYSSEAITNTVPFMSIPRGRFDRELIQFFSAFDTVEYIDPFIQNVLAPAHRAHTLHTSGAPLAQVQRAIGEIAAQDWMQACLLYVNTCTPPTE